MNCPHCKQFIENALTLTGAAQINGRKSKRTLTPEQARNMQRKSAETRRKNKK